MAITPPPYVDPLSGTPPNRGQTEEAFNTNQQNFVDYQVGFVPDVNDLAEWFEYAATTTETNTNVAVAAAGSASTSAATAVAAASSAINAPGTNATSTTSITPVIGANAFTLAQTGKTFVVGQFVTVADATTPTSKFFNGAITSFNSGTGAITVNAMVTAGSGSGSNWVITASAPAQSERFVAPVQTFIALGNVSGTVNIDLRNGLACSMTIVGNTTFTFVMPSLFTTGNSTWWLASIIRSGSYTIGYPVGTKFHDGAAPTFAVGTLNELLITWDNGSSTGIASRPRGNIA
jgi:hypothetical protein